MNNNWKVEGMNEVKDALNDLPVKIQAQVLKNFVAKAGRDFIVKPMKNELPYSQKFKKTIGIMSDAKNKLAIQAGVSSKGYKLRWLDLGTKERQTKKGYSRGSITGQNKIQPLIERQIQPILKFAEEELANEVNKILERKLKKLKKS